MQIRVSSVTDFVHTNRSLLIQWLTLTVDVGVTLECVVTWSRDVNRTYVIARQVNTRHADCYVSDVVMVAYVCSLVMTRRVCHISTVILNVSLLFLCREFAGVVAISVVNITNCNSRL